MRFLIALLVWSLLVGPAAVLAGAGEFVASDAIAPWAEHAWYWGLLIPGDRAA